MPKPRPSRRDILKSAAALPFFYAAPLCAAAPPAEAITPSLIAAATKEGRLTWYTSADLQLAENVGKIFEQKFFGIRVRVERAGGERIFSRVAQEYSSGLHVADAVSTGDAAQFLAWKRAPYVPEDVARHIPPEHRDPDGFYATVRSSLCPTTPNLWRVGWPRKVLPTCSIRDGKAKSSRRIRATAEPS
jgi:iron(III) transport system substrate-binding protein